MTIAEATADGVAPAFQGDGFARPKRVPLIEGGRLVGSLVSPRTAREFSLDANGANGDEAPEALCDGGRRARRARRAGGARAPASTSAICTTSTTPIARPAG